LNSFELFLTIAIPIGLVSPLIWLLFSWVIPEAKNDAKWEAYMQSWDDWDKNGKIGKMPRPEDFGYKNLHTKSK
jgi:hypothetical protein